MKKIIINSNFSGKSSTKIEKDLKIKISKYKKDQKLQILQGGSGPVAEIEVMQITNEHNGFFEVFDEYVPPVEEVVIIE